MADAPIRIRRVHHERDFTIIGNAAIQNEVLSFKATGLLCYLLSLPEDWCIHLADLVNRKADGKEGIRTGLRELEEAGYLTRSTRRDEATGRIVEHIMTIDEDPGCPEPDLPIVGKPDSGSPDSGSPDSGKPDATKNPLPTKDSGNKEHRAQRNVVDPERCPIEQVVAHWPRPGEQANHYKRRWANEIRRAGGPMNMAIAVNAYIAAWRNPPPGSTEPVGLRRWLDESRFSDAEQIGPLPIGGPPSLDRRLPGEKLPGEPAMLPSQVSRWTPSGEERPHDEVEAERDHWEREWAEYDRRKGGQ